MFTAQTKDLNHYNGTPPGTYRVWFMMPDGNSRSAFVRDVDHDWDVSVLVDEETETIFFVGTSPDKRGLHVERWLNGHPPRKQHYKTKTAQKADLNSKDAGTLTPEEIVTAIKDTLTSDDTPQPITKPALKLKPLTKHKEKRVETKGTKGKVIKVERVVEQAGDYQYKAGNYGKGKDGKDRIKPFWRCRTRRGAALVRTKGDPSWPLTVLHNDSQTEVFFLFTQPDGNYLLEALRETRTAYQRREVTAQQSDFAGKSPTEIVTAMADTLTYDPNAFA